MARLIVALIVSAVFTHAVFCSTISVGDASDDLAWEPTQGPEFDEFAEQVYYPEMPPDTPVVEQAVDADPGRDRELDGYQDDIQKQISGLEEKQSRHQELLEERLKKLEQSNDDLRTKLKVQEFYTDTKLMNIGRFVSKREFLVNQTLQNLLSEQVTCKNKTEQVAFSAYLSKDLNGLGSRETVKFDKTTLNHGGRYNAITGIFTAPMNGIYVFSYFVGQRGNNQIFVKLTVNGVGKSDAAVETTLAWQDAQGGNVAILQLYKEQHVYVRKNYWGSHIESSEDIRLSTFSGFLLYPL